MSLEQWSNLSGKKTKVKTLEVIKIFHPSILLYKPLFLILDMSKFVSLLIWPFNIT